MKETLLIVINEILEEKNGQRLDTLNEGTSLRKDLGFDSMDLALLTAKLDEECGVDIFEDGIIDTVEEVLKKLA